MIDKNLHKLQQQIIDETDGNKFAKLIQKLLKKYATAEREYVLNLLITYAQSGQIVHWRNFLLTDIIKLVSDNETNYIPFFEWCITQPALTYWGIDGLLKTKGKQAYPALIELIKNEQIELSIRAKAIKSIAVYSKQAFDRELPKDPGYWKLDNLRIAEIETWQNNGCPDGDGYAEPKTHLSLLYPTTELDKTAAKLNTKLEKLRAKHQDLSTPTNWLIIANETDISTIENKWQLPQNYLLFLKNFSPLNVYIDNKKYFQGLHLYGAGELLSRQDGYAFTPVTKQPIADWPTNYIVIADAGADPYCIDINQITDLDAPIYTSMHGIGQWEFELYADSFLSFLKEISGK